MSELVLFDADGTLHDGFSIFPLYDKFAQAGLVDAADNAKLTEVYAAYNEGDLEYKAFATQTLELAAMALRGKPVQQTSSISEGFFKNPRFAWYDYVRPTLIRAAKANASTVLLTAEPQFIAGSIQRALRLTASQGSVFGFEDYGRVFSGEVVHVLGSAEKGEITGRLVGNIPKSIAFGDSEGDIGMLEQVDRAICISPTPQLAQHAAAKGWEVRNPHTAESPL